MKIKVVTLFPEPLKQSLSYGVIGQALRDGAWSLETVNPREFTTDTHHTVDDRVFGGGDGMLMLAEPLALAVEKLKDGSSARVVHLSPRGRKFTDALAREWAEDWIQSKRSLILIATRYAGADARFIEEYCDDEISIGDFVVSGGDGPAALVVDAILRQLPGVLGNDKSAANDSFAHTIFESAQYTRPREWRNKSVPEVLLGGDPALISDWQFLEALEATLLKRLDLIRDQGHVFSANLEKRILEISGRMDREKRMRLGNTEENARSRALRNIDVQLKKTKEAWATTMSRAVESVKGKT